MGTVGLRTVSGQCADTRNMWWCWLAAWLVAVVAVSRGGVPPAPLHVGPYQRRLSYDQAQQQQPATLEELFREGGPPQDDWGPPDVQPVKRNEGLQAAQALASQHMLRSPRGSRQYDVPQIGKSNTNTCRTANKTPRAPRTLAVMQPPRLIIHDIYRKQHYTPHATPGLIQPPRKYTHQNNN